MDNSGNNRYELLFMDDEAGPGPAAVPLEVGAGKKKEEHATALKKSNRTEKENKSITINKNDAVTKASNSGQSTKVKSVIGGTVGRAKNPPRDQSSNQNLSNGNVQRTFKTNVRSSENNYSEFGSDPPQRQFRDRDNRGPPRFRNGEKIGKREFDRQSGSDKTGIKAVDKRDGAGAHNWGSAKQDIEDMNIAVSGETTAPLTDKEDSANEQSGEATNTLEEDESKLMTLDEWKALRDQRAKPNYNLRKAGEGVDNSEWKKMVVLNKKKDMDGEDELEYDPSLYPQRVGRLQRIVDIQFNFNDGRRGGYRKGPRGPPRAGPGPRPEFGANNGFERPKFTEKRRVGPKPLKVDDQNQFPTLS